MRVVTRAAKEMWEGTDYKGYVIEYNQDSLEQAVQRAKEDGRLNFTFTFFIVLDGKQVQQVASMREAREWIDSHPTISDMLRRGLTKLKFKQVDVSDLSLLGPEDDKGFQDGSKALRYCDDTKYELQSGGSMDILMEIHHADAPNQHKILVSLLVNLYDEYGEWVTDNVLNKEYDSVKYVIQELNSIANYADLIEYKRRRFSLFDGNSFSTNWHDTLKEYRLK